MVEQSRTWHHGLIAEWWAHFNTDGPEIEEYGHVVAEGQPALDAGCGAGRLLVPWLRAGYDVDGCDVSEDMLDRCRERARREGFEPTLWVAPLHELRAPRRYRTIVCCGTFGLGSTRAQDEAALRLLREALEPGGTLILDHEVARPGQFDVTTPLPKPWPERGDRRRADDGSEYELRVRRAGGGRGRSERDARDPRAEVGCRGHGSSQRRRTSSRCGRIRATSSRRCSSEPDSR